MLLKVTLKSVCKGNGPIVQIFEGFEWLVRSLLGVVVTWTDCRSGTPISGHRDLELETRPQVGQG